MNADKEGEVGETEAVCGSDETVGAGELVGSSLTALVEFCEYHV